MNEGKAKILVVDDEQGIRDLLAFEFKSQGYSVATASNGEEAIEKIQQEKFDIVISDIKMPKKDGIETLEAIKNISPDTEVIMATGYGTIETAVSAMKKGAYDFIQKPFDIEEVLMLVEKAIEKQELKVIIALYETSKAIFSTIKFEDLLEITVNLALKVLHADDISIMLIGDDGKLYIAVSRGLNSDVKIKTRLAIGERISGKVAQLKEPVIINGTLSNDPRFKDLEPKEGINSSLILPLIANTELVGVLNATRTNITENFRQTDLRNGLIFSSQLAQAILNSTLYKKLEQKIAELKEASEHIEQNQVELIHSEKLAAIGRLIAGVAHELNSPLTSVIGYSQLMLNAKVLPEELIKDIQIIHNEAKRCRGIVQDLLLFSRKREPKCELIDINKPLENMLELIKYDFEKAGITLVKELDVNLPKLYIDPHQTEQVFLNLANNALDALKNITNPKLIIKTELSSNKVNIHFTDNGCGISEENLKKIFEPFFTTKKSSKSSGLGLSISHGIINNHKGRLLVTSKEMKGSTFTIELPIE